MVAPADTTALIFGKSLIAERLGLRSGLGAGFRIESQTYFEFSFLLVNRL